MIAAPLAGASMWAAVITAAGGQCACTGECGSKHRLAVAGRCEQVSTPGRPLQAVPRQPCSPAAAMRLPASALTALCGPCAEARDRRTRPAASGPPPAQALFPSPARARRKQAPTPLSRPLRRG